MERAAVSASQPPSPVFQDGLGERRHITDPTGTDTIEQLCLRSDLAAVPSFEFALRERVSRLASFRHAYYGRVRGVERASDVDQTLTVASDATPGLRLSELLAQTEQRHVPLDINAALCLIRQLVPAVAMLHEAARDVAHGAIGPERLVITPNARLVVVEYVLGAALEQLRFSQERYWSELRIAVPRSAGLPRFDHRADVTQIGIVALSLILGRPLREDEFPARVGDVVAATWAVSAKGGFEPLPPGLRGWLSRALQLDARGSFPTAIEARAELDRVLGDSDLMASPASLEAYLARFHMADRPARRAAAVVAPAPIPVVTAPSARPAAVAPPLRAAVAPQVPVAEPVRSAPPVAAAPATASHAAAPDPVEGGATAEPAHRAPAVPETPAAQITAAVAASPEAAPFIAHTAPADVDRPAVTPPVTRPAATTAPYAPTFGSRAGLDEVFPQVEAAAFEFDVPARSKKPFWLAAGAVAVIALIAAGVFASRQMLPPAPAVATTGVLVITTNPAGAQAFVDGTAQGVTPLTLTLAEGPHVVELRGTGEPRSIPVTITAGMQVAQYVDLPKAAAGVGQLQVKTDPSGARVSVDGTARGTSPVLIADLAPGEHTVIVESELGTARQTVTVESGMTAALVLPLGASPGVLASGWVTVASPIDVQLFEHGQLLGSSQTDRIMVTAGRHDLEIVNDLLGFRASQTIQVPAGKVANVSIDLPKGALALNAVPWAEVWVDGEKIGDTPIGDLSLTIGSHDVVFRHPQLGEQHHSVTVTLKNPARLSVDLRKQ